MKINYSNSELICKDFDGRVVLTRCLIEVKPEGKLPVHSIYRAELISFKKHNAIEKFPNQYILSQFFGTKESMIFGPAILTAEYIIFDDLELQGVEVTENFQS